YRAVNGYAVFENPAPELWIRFEGIRPTAVTADPRVTENAGKVAFRLGATVYCLEECDNPEPLTLFADSKRLSEAVPVWNELEQRTELLVPGLRPKVPEKALYVPAAALSFQPVTLRLIPYRDFANRGDADMTVWIPCR
ncbi:MAG: hypothetical protein IKY02_04940, partial [Lachnospiraceae bacterium]|nr:hypothetical protein [Lachnospiraceae bacterium]